MNDWERLHRQAERYKQSYPPGTRVMVIRRNESTHVTASFVTLLYTG